MDVVMKLPSPKTPSTKRIFKLSSPPTSTKGTPRTPRSEGFRRRKVAIDSSSDFVSGHSPFSKSIWNTDTPPMSDSSEGVSTPFKEIMRGAIPAANETTNTISERRFYSSSTNRKCLLPLYKTSAHFLTPHRIKQERATPLKRKRSKSVDHRKRIEPEKLNKNIRHKIKRPKTMKPPKTMNLPNVGNAETLESITSPTATDNQVKIDFTNTSSPQIMNLKPKLTEKKISVNVNRMVRVNVQGGVLKFTKHLKSPIKSLSSGRREKVDLVHDASELCVDWIQDKVDSIIVNLDKENDLPNVSTPSNGSDSIQSLSDSTAHLSDAFCELEVSNLKTNHPAHASTALAERLTGKDPVNEHVETPPMVEDKEGPSSEEGNISADESIDKLFPVFYKSHQAKTRDIFQTESPKTGSPSSYPKISLPAKSTDGLEQLVIDAGQKSLAPSTCPECGFYYMSGDPDEKRMHLKYHNSSKPAIRHTGWKWERVAAKFPDGLVVHVCPSDPKPWWTKIELILETANQDLGISFASQLSKHAHAYFYVSNMVVVGCVIVEPIRVAYRMLEVDRKELERVKEPGDKIAMEAPSFCSNTPVRGSRCGINRIWTCPSERRKGVATKMLDAVRATFVYGHILKLSEIAFSDPTPMGMSLAVKYTKSTNFLVYKAIKD